MASRASEYQNNCRREKLNKNEKVQKILLTRSHEKNSLLLRNVVLLTTFLKVVKAMNNTFNTQIF